MHTFVCAYTHNIGGFRGDRRHILWNFLWNVPMLAWHALPDLQVFVFLASLKGGVIEVFLGPPRLPCLHMYVLIVTYYKWHYLSMAVWYSLILDIDHVTLNACPFLQVAGWHSPVSVACRSSWLQLTTGACPCPSRFRSICWTATLKGCWVTSAVSHPPCPWRTTGHMERNVSSFHSKNHICGNYIYSYNKVYS